MTIEEITDKVQFVIDADGNRQAVQVEIAQWENIMNLLEEMQDTIELAQARQEKEDVVPWEQVKAEYLAEMPEDGA